jgi:cysteine desulfurase / selenocysteine lyase
MAAAIGSKEEFPLLNYDAYLNYAAIAPYSTSMRKAVNGIMDDHAANGLNSLFKCLDQRAGLKEKLAKLIGAQPEDLAFVPSTTAGITSICINYPWQENDRIVVFDGEFPANVTPFQKIAEEKNLQIVFNPLDAFYTDHQVGLNNLEEELKKGVRLVAVSFVQFQTGYQMPIKEICELAHKYDAEVLVDAIQGLGAVPFDVGCGVDYMSTGSHKWLMGTEGAGFVYISPDKVGKFKSVTAGWLSHEDGLKFLLEGSGHLKYDRPVRQETSFMEPGAPNTLGYVALEAAVDMIVEIGVDNIFAHIQRYHDELEPMLCELGLKSLRSKNPAFRSGGLCFEMPDGVDVIDFNQKLGELRIGAGNPDGNFRIAPHWPNSLDEVPMIASAVAKVLKELGFAK